MAFQDHQLLCNVFGVNYGDTLSRVACFVAIKYRIKTLHRSLMNAVQLSDDDITDMITLINHRLSAIFSEPPRLIPAADSLFTTTLSLIVVRIGKKFVQLGKRSIDHQSDLEIAGMLTGRKALRSSVLAEFASFSLAKRRESWILTLLILTRHNC